MSRNTIRALTDAITGIVHCMTYTWFKSGSSFRSVECKRFITNNLERIQRVCTCAIYLLYSLTLPDRNTQLMPHTGVGTSRVLSKCICKPLINPISPSAPHHPHTAPHHPPFPTQPLIIHYTAPHYHFPHSLSSSTTQPLIIIPPFPTQPLIIHYTAPHHYPSIPHTASHHPPFPTQPLIIHYTVPHTAPHHPLHSPSSLSLHSPHSLSSSTTQPLIIIPPFPTHLANLLTRLHVADPQSSPHTAPSASAASCYLSSLD
ncbi:unnamed protein product [Ranitomeya imitator]|uniref:Uncharacterized protein n=1 Tax=Ranitomeya imitator TaxID=111125 RepID=A0ABN9M6U6_9NEOB|nr:unnamed protein product [Ranitomeya imitator]